MADVDFDDVRKWFGVNKWLQNEANTQNIVCTFSCESVEDSANIVKLLGVLLI